MRCLPKCQKKSPTKSIPNSVNSFVFRFSCCCYRPFFDFLDTEWLNNFFFILPSFATTTREREKKNKINWYRLWFQFMGNLNQMIRVIWTTWTIYFSSNFSTLFLFTFCILNLQNVWHGKWWKKFNMKNELEKKGNNRGIAQNRTKKNVFNVFPLVLISFLFSLYFIGFYYRFIACISFFSLHIPFDIEWRHSTLYSLS